MRVIVLTLTLAGLAATFFPLPDQPPPAQGDADAQGGADAHRDANGPDLSPQQASFRQQALSPQQALSRQQALSTPAAPHAQSTAGPTPKLCERGDPA
jgi:hypothetical protein